MEQGARERLDLLFKMDAVKAYFMPYIAPGVNLKIVTDLGHKDQNGNKKRFYEETLYKSSKYKNTDELVSATYRINSFLVLEYPNPSYQNGNGGMKNKTLFIKAYALDDLVATMKATNEILPRCFHTKDGKMILLSDRIKSFSTYPNMNSVITFTPDLYHNSNTQFDEIGVRIEVNEEYAFTISAENIWPELMYRISKCDLTMLGFQMIQCYMAMLPGMAVSRLGDRNYSSASRYTPYWEDPDDIVNQSSSVGFGNTKSISEEDKKKSFFSNL